MDKLDDTQKPSVIVRQSKDIKAEAKQLRLKAALRSNLRRRKEIAVNSASAQSKT